MKGKTFENGLVSIAILLASANVARAFPQWMQPNQDTELKNAPRKYDVYEPPHPQYGGYYTYAGNGPQPTIVSSSSSSISTAAPEASGEETSSVLSSVSTTISTTETITVFSSVDQSSLFSTDGSYISSMPADLLSSLFGNVFPTATGSATSLDPMSNDISSAKGSSTAGGTAMTLSSAPVPTSPPLIPPVSLPQNPYYGPKPPFSSKNSYSSSSLSMTSVGGPSTESGSLSSQDTGSSAISTSFRQGPSTASSIATLPSLSSKSIYVLSSSGSGLSSSSELGTGTNSTYLKTSSNAVTTSASLLDCQHDNCLRAFIRSASAVAAFCETYTTIVNTASYGFPMYASPCQDSPSRISSACSCAVTGLATGLLTTRPVSPSTISASSTIEQTISASVSSLAQTSQASAIASVSSSIGSSSQTLSQMSSSISGGVEASTSSVDAWASIKASIGLHYLSFSASMTKSSLKSMSSLTLSSLLPSTPTSGGIETSLSMTASSSVYTTKSTPKLSSSSMKSATLDEPTLSSVSFSFGGVVESSSAVVLPSYMRTASLSDAGYMTETLAVPLTLSTVSSLVISGSDLFTALHSTLSITKTITQTGSATESTSLLGVGSSGILKSPSSSWVTYSSLTKNFGTASSSAGITTPASSANVTGTVLQSSNLPYGSNSSSLVGTESSTSSSGGGFTLSLSGQIYTPHASSSTIYSNSNSNSIYMSSRTGVSSLSAISTYPFESGGLITSKSRSKYHHHSKTKSIEIIPTGNLPVYYSSGSILPTQVTSMLRPLSIGSTSTTSGITQSTSPTPISLSTTPSGSYRSVGPLSTDPVHSSASGGVVSFASGNLVSSYAPFPTMNSTRFFITGTGSITFCSSASGFSYPSPSATSPAYMTLGSSTTLTGPVSSVAIGFSSSSVEGFMTTTAPYASSNISSAVLFMGTGGLTTNSSDFGDFSSTELASYVSSTASGGASSSVESLSVPYPTYNSTTTVSPTGTVILPISRASDSSTDGPLSSGTSGGVVSSVPYPIFNYSLTAGPTGTESLSSPTTGSLISEYVLSSILSDSFASSIASSSDPYPTFNSTSVVGPTGTGSYSSSTSFAGVFVTSQSPSSPYTTSSNLKSSLGPTGTGRLPSSSSLVGGVSSFSAPPPNSAVSTGNASLLLLTSSKGLNVPSLSVASVTANLTSSKLSLSTGNLHSSFGSMTRNTGAIYPGSFSSSIVVTTKKSPLPPQSTSPPKNSPTAPSTTYCSEEYVSAGPRSTASSTAAAGELTSSMINLAKNVTQTTSLLSPSLGGSTTSFLPESTIQLTSILTKSPSLSSQLFTSTSLATSSSLSSLGSLTLPLSSSIPGSLTYFTPSSFQTQLSSAISKGYVTSSATLSPPPSILSDPPYYELSTSKHSSVSRTPGSSRDLASSSDAGTSSAAHRSPTVPGSPKSSTHSSHRTSTYLPPPLLSYDDGDYGLGRSDPSDEDGNDQRDGYDRDDEFGYGNKLPEWFDPSADYNDPKFGGFGNDFDEYRYSGRFSQGDGRHHKHKSYRFGGHQDDKGRGGRRNDFDH